MDTYVIWGTGIKSSVTKTPMFKIFATSQTHPAGQHTSQILGDPSRTPVPM